MILICDLFFQKCLFYCQFNDFEKFSIFSTRVVHLIMALKPVWLCHENSKHQNYLNIFGFLRVFTYEYEFVLKLLNSLSKISKNYFCEIFLFSSDCEFVDYSVTFIAQLLSSCFLHSKHCCVQ